jgi:hypothetical protein
VNGKDREYIVRSWGLSALCPQAHIHTLLLEVLSAVGPPWAADPDVQLKACRALLNLSSHAALTAVLREGGAVAAVVERYCAHQDMRVCDAASGCLLQLQALPDARVREAAELSAVAQTAAAAVSGGDTGRSGVGGGPPQYDAFLSHKRADAKDFARALYNLLVLRGFTTFLDFEFREELTDLGGFV